MAALLDSVTHLGSEYLRFQKFDFWNTVARCFTSVFPLLSLPGDVAMQPFLGGFSPLTSDVSLISPHAVTWTVTLDQKGTESELST